MENENKEKIRVLWYGDSPVVNTGFGVVSKSIVERLAKTGKYHVTCVGINDRATDPNHPLRHNPNVTCVPVPYLDRDPYGYEVLPQVMQQFKPDVVLALNDIWLLTGHPHHQNVDWFYQMCKQYVPQAPIIVYFPVDGEPFHPHWIQFCNQINRPVVYSDYGFRVVRDGGFSGDLRTIYHGADLSKFYPLPPHVKEAQRKEFGIPDDYHLIGIVARNQPRKNIPIAVRIIKMLKDGYVRCNKCKKIYCLEFSVCPICGATERVKGSEVEGIKKIATYLHMNLDDRRGHKLRKVIPDEKLSDIVFNPSHEIATGVPIEKLNMIYNSFDVMFLPTTCEGYGLPIIESMAAGCPVIATDCTAISEMLRDNRGFLVPPQDYMIMDDASNTRKYIIDVEGSVNALREALTNKELREEVIMNALIYASEKDWDTPTKQFDALIEETLAERVSIVDSFKSGNSVQKVFVIREVGDGGDLLCTLPAVRAIKENLRNCEIVYAVPDDLVPLLEGNPVVDKVISIKHLWDGTRQNRNNVAIGKVNMYGPEVRYENATLPNIDRSRHEIFCHSVGFKPSSYDIPYAVLPKEKEFARSYIQEKAPNEFKKVFLKVDAPEIYKAWPEESWMKLAKSLSNFKDMKIFIVAEGHSINRWDKWASETEEAKDKVYIINESEIGIKNSIALLNFMDLVVSADGPYLHYAGALKRSILCLAGPVDYKVRLKHYANAHVIVKKDKFHQCLPCWRNAQTACAVNNSLEKSECMSHITAGEVFAKIATLLNPILSRASNKRRKEAFAGVV